MPLVVAAIIGAGATSTARHTIASSGQERRRRAPPPPASKYAADLQAKLERRSRRLCESAGREPVPEYSEVSRRGNYDQWAAAQHRLGSVGDSDRHGPAGDSRLRARHRSELRRRCAPVPRPRPRAPSGDPANQALVRDAIAHGLTGQAAIDYINQQKPGSAVLVPAGSPTPNGKIAWYDKGNGNGKFQMIGPENWEIKIDPALGPGWVFNPLGNGAPTAAAPRSTVPAWNQPLTWNQPTYQNVPMTPALGMPPVRSVADYLGN
jgi:hypothetical protein